MQVDNASLRAWGRVMAAAALLVAVASGTDARAADWRSDRSGNYLVIAAEDYFDSAPLNQFVAAKEAMGFDVTTYSVTSGTSNTTIEDAVRGAISRAANTLHNLRWFEIVGVRGGIENQVIDRWQVTIKVGFTLDE